MRTDRSVTLSPSRKTRPGMLALVLALLAVAIGARADEAQPPAPDQTDGKKDKDLAKRLVDGEDAADDDLMTQIVALMQQSRDRLHRAFDPGPQTQALQRRILAQLDEAIELALRQRSSAGAAQTESGDRRQMPDADEQARRAQERQEAAEKAREEATHAVTDADAQEARRSGAFKETKRGWGHLPPREREEIIQGVSEEVLDDYRDLIDRYYRALAEPEEP